MTMATIDTKPFVIDCLKQKTIAADIDLEAYLKNKGVSELLIPIILRETLKIEQSRRAARSRLQEGGVITSIGLGGIAYATANQKDGTAWLIWSMVGLGILANGLWKRKRTKMYN